MKEGGEGGEGGRSGLDSCLDLHSKNCLSEMYSREDWTLMFNGCE